MNKITTIFFDVDDTLINHSKAQVKGIEAVRNKYFPQIPKQDFVKIWMEIQEQFWEPYMRGEITYGEQRTQRITLVWNTFGKIIADDEVSEVLNLQMTHYQNSWEAFPSVVETLEQLHGKGYKLGIISNGNKKQQSQKLKKIDVLNYISQELFFVSETVGIAKPNPEIFLLAQEKAKELAKNILFIGDNPMLDIEPAQKLGWNTFLIDHFKQNRDKKSIQNFQEISSIFG